MKRNKKIFTLLMLTILLLELGQIRVFSQVPTPAGEYAVRVGEKLYMTIPQRTDLNREMYVDSNGNITIPLIGDIQVQGLTLPEIEAKVFQALQGLYPSINRIEITIMEAFSQAVYVFGQVGNPGRYTYSITPNLWEAIRDAGGPTREAALENVRIVKDRSKGGSSSTVDLQQAIEYGTIDDLPDLENGDTVIIPLRTEVYSGPLGISVFGAVVRPGSYNLGAKKDLLSALLLAGGPTELAVLGSIKIIRHMDDGSVKTVEVDLQNYFDNGDPLSNPTLKVRDTIQVPEKNRFVQSMLSGVFLVSLVTAGVSLATLIVATRD